MLCDDEVLVLVHEQQGAVGDLASIVIHREAMWRPLGRLKPGLLSQPGAHSMGQILQILSHSLYHCASAESRPAHPICCAQYKPNPAQMRPIPMTTACWVSARLGLEKRDSLSAGYCTARGG